MEGVALLDLRDLGHGVMHFLQGDLNLHGMVTARYKIEQINEAAQALEKGQITGRAILEFDH